MKQKWLYFVLIFEFVLPSNAFGQHCAGLIDSVSDNTGKTYLFKTVTELRDLRGKNPLAFYALAFDGGVALIFELIEGKNCVEKRRDDSPSVQG